MRKKENLKRVPNIGGLVKLNLADTLYNPNTNTVFNINSSTKTNLDEAEETHMENTPTEEVEDLRDEL